MNEQEQAIQVAVLREQITGLRVQQHAMNENTQRRFDYMEAKIDELVAVMNRGRGAYAASLMLAGAVGATLLKGMSIMASYFQR